MRHLKIIPAYVFFLYEEPACRKPNKFTELVILRTIYNISKEAFIREPVIKFFIRNLAQDLVVNVS